jgi:hypothetical protein
VVDAMGGRIENFLPEQIFEEYGNWGFNGFFISV